MMSSTQVSQTFNCPDCNFSTSSQGGLCIHRTKSHKPVSTSIKTVSVVRSYPEGKNFICGICGNSLVNFPNLKRHFKNIHPDTVLLSSVRCSICNTDFPNAQAVSVHCHRAHDVSKKNQKFLPSPTPILSQIINNSGITSDVSPPRYVATLRPTRTTRNKRSLPIKNITFTDNCDQSTLPLLSSQPTSPELLTSCSRPLSQDASNLVSSSSRQLTNTHSREIDVNSIDHPNTIHDSTFFNQQTTLDCNTPITDPNESLQHCSSPLTELDSNSLSRFIIECGNLTNLPPSVPQRPSQTIGLSSSDISSFHVSSPQTVVNDSSRFTTPAPSPFPRHYQRPTAVNILRPGRLPHPSYNRSSPFTQRADTADILLDPTSHITHKPVAPDFIPSSHHTPPFPSNSVINTNASIHSCLSPEELSTSVNSQPHVNCVVSSQSQRTPSSTPSELRLKKEAFHDKWSTSFSGDIPWSDFCSLCDGFAVESRSLALEIAAESSPSFRRPKPIPRPDRPSGRRPAFRHRPLLSNPAEAQRIQTLYRHSKKKAARKILSPNSPFYSGSPENAETFFKNTFALRSCDISSLEDKLNDLTTPAPVDDSLFLSPTKNEIRRKLFSAANTSAGPDRVEYRHLKSVDPSCSILSLIFQHCFMKRDVPPAWKSACTVLIYKKGNTDDPSNFRPIALMSCIYKLVMGIIAKRLTAWSIDNDLLSKEQKSARPSEGCYEHTFLLQSIIGETRRSHKNVYVAWLDLRNAFGSVPHSAITSTLSHIGVPAALIEMITNSYTGATTKIRTPNNLTPDIPVLSGVKQGCPLSPIIFNLTIDIILRAIKHTASVIGPAKLHGTPFSVLAYADDLVIISRKKDSLQKLLDSASSTATTLGLSFRSDKCASISLTCSNSSPSPFELNEYIVQDNPIPSLDREHPYKYLGVPIGLIHDPDNIHDLVQNLSRDLENIEKSLLAPWQKLDMIRTFLQPSLTFALRAGFPKKQHLLEYRSRLVATVRKICSLPNRATVSYIFAHKRAGGLGLLDPNLEADVQAIIHAVKILSCSDPTIIHIANSELNHTVRLASQSNPTPALKSNYLSSLSDDRLNNLRYNIQSLWTRVRKSSRNLGIEIKFNDNGLPVVSSPNSSPVLAKEISRFLHFHVQDRFASNLFSLPDQGKVARALTTDTFANGSTWQYNGLNIRFRDWRFIHRARLNCLPLNSIKSRWSNASPKCRHCIADETLPHVLCHCLPNMPSILRRHNNIVDRIVNAVQHGTVTTDQQVRAANSRLRPDIIVEEGNKVLIIDVCCPFENDAEALRDAEQRKLNKYDGLKQFFIGQGKQCEVFGFVVGALGSWHPANENVLRHLGMSKRYRSLFRKLCCSDAIQGSTNIYREHLGITEETVDSD